MKKIYTILILVISFSVCLSSCKGFLDKAPDDKNVSIDNLDKISELLSSAYPRASYFRFLELRTDNVGKRGGDQNYERSRLNDAMYHWREYSEEDLDSPNRYWIECYRGIGNANKALELLVKYKDKNDPSVRSLYAEALILRAYLHFMIANIWAPPYEGEDSKITPAIPYVEKVEKNAFPTYERGNLYDLYQKIERDLLAGLSIVSDNFYVRPQYRFNTKAAYAFATRFFLYEGKWDKVVAYASAILPSNTSTVLRKWNGFRAFNRLTAMQKIDYFNNAKTEYNLLTVTPESVWATNNKTDIYGFNERAFSDALNPAEGAHSLEAYEKGVERSRDPIYYQKFSEFVDAEGAKNSKRGHYTENVLFRMEEVLLNRAEAYAMLGNPVLSLNDINAFIDNKKQEGAAPSSYLEDFRLVNKNARDLIQPYYRPLDVETASLVYVISQYRRMEFIHEGLRWFDIRRFRLKVNRNLPASEQIPDDILQVEDNRKTMPIPAIAYDNGVKDEN